MISKSSPQSQSHIFQAHFDQLLDPKHPLVILANKIDWKRFDLADKGLLRRRGKRDDSVYPQRDRALRTEPPDLGDDVAKLTPNNWRTLMMQAAGRPESIQPLRHRQPYARQYCHASAREGLSLFGQPALFHAQPDL